MQRNRDWFSSLKGTVYQSISKRLSLNNNEISLNISGHDKKTMKKKSDRDL